MHVHLFVCIHTLYIYIYIYTCLSTCAHVCICKDIQYNEACSRRNARPGRASDIFGWLQLYHLRALIGPSHIHTHIYRCICIQKDTLYTYTDAIYIESNVCTTTIVQEPCVNPFLRPASPSTDSSSYDPLRRHRRMSRLGAPFIRVHYAV